MYIGVRCKVQEVMNNCSSVQEAAEATFKRITPWQTVLATLALCCAAPCKKNGLAVNLHSDRVWPRDAADLWSQHGQFCRCGICIVLGHERLHALNTAPLL